MKNIVILISGRGSNMQAIVEAAIPGARIAAVISNRPDAAGLAWAAERGIATVALDHKQYASREAFDEALAAAIDSHDAHLVVLAGFMRILTPAFTQRYEGRMLNIHPSLLPAFTGLHTHQRAIEAGCKLAGCTVHFVTAELDHGPIAAQAAVPVLDDDTEATLSARVLVEEHRLYPAVVKAFVEDRIRIEGLRVSIHNE
ncbi:MAG: phosphoribosylglycinamide formyltransferase [Burkholderiales bacterium]|nr:phosphoribosylglycinamide formyltransferase [Burkholderiales bacterium]